MLLLGLDGSLRLVKTEVGIVHSTQAVRRFRFVLGNICLVDPVEAVHEHMIHRWVEVA